MRLQPSTAPGSQGVVGCPQAPTTPLPRGSAARCGTCPGAPLNPVLGMGPFGSAEGTSAGCRGAQGHRRIRP
jgi:hypothetical protein